MPTTDTYAEKDSGKSNVILCRINQTGSQGIFCGFMNSVDTKLTKDVLAMCIHCMEARKPLFCNLTRSHSKGYILQYFVFCRCKFGAI